MNINTKVKIDNMKIDNIPLVLTKQLFVVVENETTTKGYWKNSKGKVYIDNIEVKQYFAINYNAFENMKQLLFAKGEEAIFWKNSNNYAIIENKEGKKEVLKQRIAWIENKKPSKEYIEVLLKQHNGLTIYQLEEGLYLIEVYKA